MNKVKIKTKVQGHVISGVSDHYDFTIETDYVNGKVYVKPLPDDFGDTHILREYAAALEKAADLMDKYCPDEELED